MGNAMRESGVDNRNDSRCVQGVDQEETRPRTHATRCYEQIQEGVESVAGAARLSIAAVEDMLDGKLTPQEASVVNTATGRMLKGCELHLKYARAGGPQLCLPD